MSGLNGGYSAATRPPRRVASRMIGTAIVALLLADGAVAATGASLTSDHHVRSAPAYRPLADAAPAPAVAASVAQAQRSTAIHFAKHRAAKRRIAAAIAAQSLTSKAARHHSAASTSTSSSAGASTNAPSRSTSTTSTPSTSTPTTSTPSGRRIGTTTHAVQSTATVPGVKPHDIGTVVSGGLISGTAPKKDLKLVPRLTYLATMKHAAKGYATATAKHADRKVPRNWYGRTSVLPILLGTKKRIEVRLSRRPNEATTWIKVSAMNLGYSEQAILLDLSQRRLYVFKDGKQKFSFPIGIGRPQTPTPTGSFFLAFHAPPNGPGYGSVMLETSAHSTVFKTFEGGNDAIIAIHGPIGSDAAIGTNGARISNGCIRMHEYDLVKVARVEDGSPIIITH